MARIPIPPPHEPLSADDGKRANDTWYRYWESNSRGLESVTSGLSTLPAISTATTFAQTILATTTASQVRTILGIEAADVAGTWTPGLAIAGTTIAAAPSVAVGRYVQTASMVHAWGTITVTTLGATTGAITIAGLPVRASSTTPGARYGGAVTRYAGIQTPGTVAGFYVDVTTGSTVVNVYFGSQTAGGAATLGSSALASTALSISVSVSYETSL